MCVDEKSQVQALDQTHPLLPQGLGYIEQQTHDYERHGTTSLFAAFNSLTGEVIARCHRRHRHQEFLKFLKHIDQNVPDDKEIHWVMDTYATHKTASVPSWLARRKNWHILFTSTSASWLNQVERFFAKISLERIRKGTFKSVQALEKAIKEYIDHYNKDPRPFAWTAPLDRSFIN